MLQDHWISRYFTSEIDHELLQDLSPTLWHPNQGATYQGQLACHWYNETICYPADYQDEGVPLDYIMTKQET